MNLPHESCYDAVRHVANKKGITDYKLEVYTGSNKGDNYIGDIFEIVLKDNANPNNDPIHLLMKTAPVNNRDDIPIDIMYNREIFAYKHVFKAFAEHQDKANFEDDVKFSFVNCFYTSDEEGKELLVFEDLKKLGFSVLGRKGRIEYEHAVLVIASLAKFHALSFVLKRQNPAVYVRLIKRVPNYVFGNKVYVSYIRASLDMAVKSVEDSVVKEKLLQIKKNFDKHLIESTNSDADGVICHGDCWINNAMFKYKDAKPTDVRLIDYQVLRHSPPAEDLMYFIFTSTDGRLRRAHYNTFLQHYYSTLSTALQAYGCDAEEVFSREAYDRQIKASARFGLAAGITFCKQMVCCDEEIMSIGNIANLEELSPPKGESYKDYVRRITEIVEDGIQYGYIQKCD